MRTGPLRGPGGNGRYHRGGADPTISGRYDVVFQGIAGRVVAATVGVTFCCMLVHQFPDTFQEAVSPFHAGLLPFESAKIINIVIARTRSSFISLTSFVLLH